MTPRRALGPDIRGNTLIEFAIIFPVMMALFMMLGDFLYRAYAQALLDGAIQKAGRDSAIQGGGDEATNIDAAVTDAVRDISRGATFTTERRNYNSFSVMKPEVIDDKNGNGRLDSKECFYDVNGNKNWDVDPTRDGQGAANDVTRYVVTVNYPRLFPVTGFFGASAWQQISAMTLLKNQPYARQTRTVERVCLP